ncbi:DUF5103 domain-containing protein [Mucilaginibacter hurinus]|uniref:DUF5103 domain-containing protein n=1 Tax=Mucilaginibacter hurinus TaxID=2201324 RepID=A0A367GSQ6_9SPHI|nr:DUF5103 domain-containing protein [Mucilaginibacter hurinus]RCH56464.1 DUF5103 domain-containing protein [Mucilaginibacter hurinus]
MMKKLISLLLFNLSLTFAFGQPYTETVYKPGIASIEFYNESKQGSIPILPLNSNERVVIAFDDLSGQTGNYYYTVEHCDANWNSSRLSPAEYLQSFTEDQFLTYKYSTGTYRKYVHYEIKFPNANLIPKYAGNYILKVYEDGDKSKLVFTRKLYIINSRVSINANVVQSNDPLKRLTNQKLNFTVDYGSLRVQNPNTDMRVYVTQNLRPDAGLLNTKPTYIRGTQLVYNDVNINDYPGRNEFRLFDMRSLKAGARNIERIFRDTANVVLLNLDINRANEAYSFQYDNNGNFLIINQDGYDTRVDGDYAWVYFTLDAKKNGADGSAYVVGRFNNYQLNDKSKLRYDPEDGRFFTRQFLKQGVYDYEYIWVDSATGKASDIVIEGSHYETENDYQLFVYYRPPGSRWEELAGFQQVNTGSRR